MNTPIIKTKMKGNNQDNWECFTFRNQADGIVVQQSATDHL